jgi:hypothetical protein
MNAVRLRRRAEQFDSAFTARRHEIVGFEVDEIEADNTLSQEQQSRLIVSRGRRCQRQSAFFLEIGAIEHLTLPLELRIDRNFNIIDDNAAVVQSDTRPAARKQFHDITPGAMAPN